MTKSGLPEEVMAEARRLIANGHSVSNSARIVSKKFKRSISCYVLSYWLDDKFRERKRRSCRERNKQGRARVVDARKQSKDEDKSST